MHRLALSVAIAAVVLGSTDAFAKYNEKLLTDGESPVSLSLTARADVDGYQGYLTEGAERFESAALVSRPVSGGWKLAQADAPPPEGGEAPPPPQSSGGRQELEQELADLQANPPGLVKPIILTVGGVVLFYVGYMAYIIGAYAAAAGSSASFGIVAILGLVVMIAGIAIGIVGAILLVKAVIGKVKHSRRMREIENELQQQSVPPPSSTPSVRFDGQRLRPQFTVATF